MYFRTYARSIGCVYVDAMGDLQVWQYIIAYQEHCRMKLDAVSLTLGRQSHMPAPSN